MSWPSGHFPAGGQPDPNLLLQHIAASMGGVPLNSAPPPPPVPQLQPSSAQPAMDNAMQMILARLMSVPLATYMFQSLMSGQQQAPAPPPVFQSPPVMHPTGPLQSPSAVMHMFQQVFQASAASSVATTPPPQPIRNVASPPVAPPSTSSATSPTIQLPPMEPAVARDLLMQLVQQLQQAGQLPYNDTIQRLLTPNAEADAQPPPPPVEIKQEELPVVPPSPGDSPICVISKTESFDEKPQPEVYMDIAEDVAGNLPSTSGRGKRELDSVEGVGSYTRSGRSTKNKQTATVTEGKHRKSFSSSSSASSTSINHDLKLSTSSTSINQDPKLSTKCLVKLDKVDPEKKPIGISQQSRVDRLKNMKRHYDSADILPTSSSSAPSTTTTTVTSTAASSKSPVDQREKMPANQSMSINLLSPPSSSRFGTKNIFSIFAQHVIGRGVQPEEPVAEVRPSDPLPASVGVLLQRSVNSSQNKTLSLRSMYLGYASQNMEWLSLISCTFTAVRKTYCQCTFCPKLGELPRDVAVHISRDHQDLLFALNKLKPLVGPLMYIKCRHCNYVTVESTLAWIHFDIHHGISDILDCSDRAADMDISGPDMPERMIDIDSVMGATTAYVCFDCSAVNADPDTNASSMLMARHVACQHPNSVNCNGNFIKLMMLMRTQSDPDSIKGTPTYRQAITEARHARGRREVFICMFCR